MATTTRKYNSDLRNGKIVVSRGHKWCPSCSTVKKKSQFAKNKSSFDGISGHCKTCKIKQQRDYQIKNVEKINGKNRIWYHKDGNGRRVYYTKTNDNPELYRMLGRKKQATRRARLHDAFIEIVDPQIVFERDEGICGICLDPVEHDEGWEVDHIIPLARGGEHGYENVQLAHIDCNRIKSDRPVRVLPDGDWEFDY